MAGAIFRDNFNDVKVVQALDPVNATSTKTSATVDTKGYESATAWVYYGTNGDTLDGSNYWTAAIHESDASGSGFAAAAAGDVIVNPGETAANAFGINNSASDDNALYCLGYRGDKRYLRVVVTLTGTAATGTPMAAGVNLAHPRKLPVANSTQLS